MLVREIMQTDIVTATPQMSIRRVARLLLTQNLSALPVTDPLGNVLGIVCERDLIYRLASPHLPPHIELLGGIIYLENPFEMKRELQKIKAVNVKDIMIEDVVTIEPDADVGEVATMMVERNLTGIPVVDGEKLLGIITRHDLLSALSDGLEAIENHVVTSAGDTPSDVPEEEEG